MLLQTIQPLSIWEKLQKDSIVFSQPNYEEYDDKNYSWNFKISYNWLKEQMNIKGITPQANEKDLFWAWAWAGDLGNKKVDLRTRRHGLKEPHVLLTIEKPPEDILISDFHLWHYVLNYWSINSSKKEEREWDKICKVKAQNFYRNKPLSQPELHQKIEQSWQAIFKIEEKENNFYSTLDIKTQKFLDIYNEKLIAQATFWNIKKEDVKKVQMISSSLKVK